jgi:trk system potassium uptake protein TrkA
MKQKYVIIIGCGRLGALLANRLSIKGNSMVVVDNVADNFSQLGSDFSGFTIEGDATEVSVLRKSGIEKANMLLAVTNNDNINLMIAQIAKEIYHVPDVVARVYDPKRVVVYNNMNINTICPILLAADAFSGLLGI